MSSSIEDLREMIAEYKPYIPLVEEIVDEAAPVLEKVFGRFLQYMREQTMASISYYKAQGLSHRDAILLVINGNVALAEAVKNMGNKQNK